MNAYENDECCVRGRTAPSSSETITSFSGISGREVTTCSKPELVLQPEWFSAGVLAACMMTDSGSAAARVVGILGYL